jgi:TolA-binding protein
MKKCGLKIACFVVFILPTCAAAFGAEQGVEVCEPNLPEQLLSIRNRLAGQQIEALAEPSRKPDAGSVKDKLEKMIESIGLLRIPEADKKASAAGETKDAGQGSALAAGKGNESQENRRQDGKAIAADAGVVAAEKEKPQQPKADPLNALDEAKEVDCPLSVADVLYLKGDYVRAARFYEMALKDVKADQQRQWALFQMGNCWRDSDGEKAAGYFERLIGEYPNSPWADASRAQGQYRKWLKKNEIEISKALGQREPNSI